MQLHVTDRSAYRSVRTALWAIQVVRAAYPDRFRFHPQYFDRVAGTSTVREGIEAGKDVDEILAGLEPAVEEFARKREPYLLYP